jgi:hypothetical protein
VTVLNDGDRVVYHLATGDFYYIKLAGIWYEQTNKRDVVIQEDIKNGWAEKV